VDAAKAAVKSNPTDVGTLNGLYIVEYYLSKYIRGDNTPEIAKYLGYLDARTLYPEFKPMSMSQYIDEVLAGKGLRSYVDKFGGSLPAPKKA
jgi:hypothetical protein